MREYKKTAGVRMVNKKNELITANVPIIKTNKLISDNFDINAIDVISLFKSYRVCFGRKFIEEKIIYINI